MTRGLLDLPSFCQFMGGALDVSGSASYIKDTCDNSNTARLIFTWTSRSRTERLETEFKSVVTNYCSSVVAEGPGSTPPVGAAHCPCCEVPHECAPALAVYRSIAQGCWVSARQCIRMSHSLAPVHSWGSAMIPHADPLRVLHHVRGEGEPHLRAGVQRRGGEAEGGCPLPVEAP